MERDIYFVCRSVERRGKLVWMPVSIGLDDVDAFHTFLLCCTRVGVQNVLCLVDRAGKELRVLMAFGVVDVSLEELCKDMSGNMLDAQRLHKLLGGLYAESKKEFVSEG